MMGKLITMIQTKSYAWVPEGEAILINRGETIEFHLKEKTGTVEIKSPKGVKIVNLKLVTPPIKPKEEK
jgi:hypothetical protein